VYLNEVTDAGVAQNMRQTVTQVERYHSNIAQYIQSILVFIAVAGPVTAFI
jgi:hypothetical protein